MPENFTSALKVSILGSSAKNIEWIKAILEEIPLKIILAQTYSTFTASLATFADVDFVATDYISFIELEEKMQIIAAPLIVFTVDDAELKSAYNLIFETISIPLNVKKFEKTVKKIQLIKKYYEKKSASFHLKNEITGNVSKTFLIKKGKEFQLINTDDIAIFYTDNKLTFAYNNDGSKFLIQSTLIELEAQLNTTHFFRANRQCLINRKHNNKINQLEDGRFEIVITAIDFLQIDISQQKFIKLKEWIENN